jgi:hypothetical protein
MQPVPQPAAALLFNVLSHAECSSDGAQARLHQLHHDTLASGHLGWFRQGALSCPLLALQADDANSFDGPDFEHQASVSGWH